MASAGATRKALTKAMIEDLTPPDLAKPDQDAIAATLGAMDDKIEANRRANQNLEDLARAFFSHNFPHDPEDDLPPGWHATRVSEVADINARTLGKTDELPSIEYVEISEVNRGRIGNTALYERGTEPSRARRRLSHGDTVMSTVRPERGSYFLCLDPQPNLIASTGFAVISPHKVPWSFLYLALTHPEVFDYLERLAVGALPSGPPRPHWRVAPRNPIRRFHNATIPRPDRTAASADRRQRARIPHPRCPPRHPSPQTSLRRTPCPPCRDTRRGGFVSAVKLVLAVRNKNDRTEVQLEPFVVRMKDGTLGVISPMFDDWTRTEDFDLRAADASLEVRQRATADLIP